jgi:NAD(P)-dependent dehydrogenase (short-subunit alcohol dehydrogenase family)
MSKQTNKQSTDPRTKFPKPGKKEKPQKFPGLESSMVTKPDYGRDSYIGSGKLEGKVALITGADSGIGRAVAVAFAKEGANVALAYLPEEERDAKETALAIKETGKVTLSLPGDLMEDSYCKKIVELTYKEFGALDILVNNAALQKYFKSIDEIGAKDFEEIYRVNVVAPFLLSKYAAQRMHPGSSIINTVSIQAYEPSSLLLPYAASKGAFVALTKGLAEELLEKGIRVNAIAPGPIWSPLNTHASPPEKLHKFGEKSSFGRPGQPIELAPVYVLLASDGGSYITGEIYGITGGEGIA